MLAVVLNLGQCLNKAVLAPTEIDTRDRWSRPYMTGIYLFPIPFLEIIILQVVTSMGSLLRVLRPTGIHWALRSGVLSLHKRVTSISFEVKKDLHLLHSHGWLSELPHLLLRVFVAFFAAHLDSSLFWHILIEVVSNGASSRTTCRPRSATFHDCRHLCLSYPLILVFFHKHPEGLSECSCFVLADSGPRVFYKGTFNNGKNYIACQWGSVRWTGKTTLILNMNKYIR